MALVIAGHGPAGGEEEGRVVERLPHRTAGVEEHRAAAVRPDRRGPAFSCGSRAIEERPRRALGPDHQRARLAGVERQVDHLAVVARHRQGLELDEVRDVRLEQPHGPAEAARLVHVRRRAPQAPPAGHGQQQERQQQARGRDLPALPLDGCRHHRAGEEDEERNAVDADPGRQRQGTGHVHPGIAGEVPRKAAAEVGPQPLQRHPQRRQHQQAPDGPPSPDLRPQPAEHGVEEGEVGREQAGQHDRQGQRRGAAVGLERGHDPVEADHPEREAVYPAQPPGPGPGEQRTRGASAIHEATDSGSRPKQRPHRTPLAAARR